MFPEGLEEIDDDDPRLDNRQPETCNAVRRKIRNWTESGAQKIGEFQIAIGVSSKAYGSFMNRTKTWDGDGCDTYWKAMMFFRKREIQGLPLQVPKAKKAKTTNAAKGGSGGKSQDGLLDTGDTEVPGEKGGVVSVFSTCDEVRKQMRALLAKGVTQAAFARKLSAINESSKGKTMTVTTLRTFLGNKNSMDGNTSAAFYAGYIFFERMRIKEGKKKSVFREEMERLHRPNGVETETDMRGPFVVMAGSVPTVDRYGVFSTVPGR